MARIIALCASIVLFQVAVASADHPGEPKSSVGHRGYGSSRPCPWNCKMAGLPADKCRDWKTGNTCYIEDFTRAPRSSNDAAQGAAVAQNPAPAANQPAAPAVVAQGQDQTRGAGYQECRQASTDTLGRPTVEIGDVERSGGLFSDKYNIRGSVEGVCIVEAGVFEGGKKIQDIPVVTAREFRRFDFDVKASAGVKPEIRAYNINGQRDVFQFTGPR
jgi:hypothetical protein